MLSTKELWVIPIVTTLQDENVRTTFDKELTPRVEELLELIEQSRDEGNTEQELKQSLQLYDVLKQRKQQDADVFEVAFGIARIYDDQLEDSGTATIYYRDALAMLEAISTRPSVEGAYMRVTTLGALAMCYENLYVIFAYCRLVLVNPLSFDAPTSGQSEDATNYFNDAISAYEEHCDQASKVGSSEVDVSDSDISLLLNLNATAAMIHYHFAGNLLAQERWDEAKNVTKIALELAENSSMSTEELEELQHCIHELWLELE
ncbi:hypothetical protein KXD40_007093 [Peronospora effusa]|uniref:14-3-3 domain-containing protein n=1 Tax=Peronospora effusa TaxID=542832 RepID=A0A3M6V7B5_9STRA|nr:hypothetical protein DD238_004109 [Peronospora effusa]RQM15446.1 hypothetical protein DD237_003459 [Peronospora effusa]UIZ24741.1 hypothetical protein KXD40_007093 [Peronospora effusa]